MMKVGHIFWLSTHLAPPPPSANMNEPLTWITGSRKNKRGGGEGAGAKYYEGLSFNLFAISLSSRGPAFFLLPAGRKIGRITQKGAE